MSRIHLREYLKEFNESSSIEQKWTIAEKYKSNVWMIDISIIAGDYIGDYWVIEDAQNELGKISLAMLEKDEGTMKSVKAKPIGDYEALELTGAALIVIK